MILITFLISTAFGFNAELVQKVFYSTVLIQQPNNSHCTGVLIDEQTVLTAAHCVVAKGYLKDIQVSLNIKTSSKADAVFVTDSVFRIQPHPQEVDLAVLKLKKPIPQKLNVARLPLDLNSSYDTYQSQALLMGYGITAKARVNSQQFEKENLFPKIRGKFFDLRSAKNNGDELLLDNQSAQACSGDSGGPLLAMTKNGDIRLIGIITRVIANPAIYAWNLFVYSLGFERKNPIQICTGQAAFLTVANYKSWILDAAK